MWGKIKDDDSERSNETLEETGKEGDFKNTKLDTYRTKFKQKVGGNNAQMIEIGICKEKTKLKM